MIRARKTREHKLEMIARRKRRDARAESLKMTRELEAAKKEEAKN